MEQNYEFIIEQQIYCSYKIYKWQIVRLSCLEELISWIRTKPEKKNPPVLFSVHLLFVKTIDGQWQLNMCLKVFWLFLTNVP